MADDNQSERINIGTIVERAWRGKWILVLTTTVTVCLMVLYLHLATPYYTATITVAPMASTDSQSGLASAVAGAASLVGIQIGGQTSTTFQMFSVALTAPDVVDRLEKRHHVLKKYYAKYWDDSTQSWHEPLLSRILDVPKALVNAPTWAPPTSATLANDLTTALTSGADVNGFLTVTIQRPDPDFAKSFLTQLCYEAAEVMRERSRDQTGDRIAYLSKQTQSVTNVDQNTALVSLLSQQEQQMMMVAADRLYGVDVVTPAWVSEYPTFPQPIIFTVYAIVMGLVIGYGIVFVLDKRGTLNRYENFRIVDLKNLRSQG